jgi:hypothetical protein
MEKRWGGQPKAKGTAASLSLVPPTDVGVLRFSQALQDETRCRQNLPR